MLKSTQRRRYTHSNVHARDRSSSVFPIEAPRYEIFATSIRTALIDRQGEPVSERGVSDIMPFVDPPPDFRR